MAWMLAITTTPAMRWRLRNRRMRKNISQASNR
jgi:hypothetical protein